jgi:DnaK suppressor protein
MATTKAKASKPEPKSAKASAKVEDAGKSAAKLKAASKPEAETKKPAKAKAEVEVKKPAVKAEAPKAAEKAKPEPKKAAPPVEEAKPEAPKPELIKAAPAPAVPLTRGRGGSRNLGQTPFVPPASTLISGIAATSGPNPVTVLRRDFEDSDRPRWTPGVSVADLPLPEGYVPRMELPKGYRPNRNEEYMSEEQLEYFRRKLVIWRGELLAESQQTIENLREEVRDVGDEAERATRETENSLELRTRDRYRKLIAKIDKALKRIEDGRYGYCEETDEEIGLERLEARPIATLCLDAQERREHRQRQMGD